MRPLWCIRSGVLIACAVLLLAGVAPVGCAKEGGTALDPEAFYPAPQAAGPRRHLVEDRPEPFMYDHVRVDLMDPQPGVRLPALDNAAGGAGVNRPRVTGISESVRESVQLPPGVGSSNPRAGTGTPARVPVGISNGVAMTLGAVVCEVNGTPIYADKILNSLTNVLAAEAKRLGPRAFREFAEMKIREEVKLFVDGELAYAAALRNLDASEQDLANRLTMDWRTRQISQAGGSIEKARAQALAREGRTFEELVQDKHRMNMVGVYYEKRLLPRAQVRADDMRRYYERSRTTLFTERPEAHFRVIKVDSAKTGSIEQAHQKIEHLRERAARGEDFSEMARSVNDDPNLMRLAGDVGWVQQGAFAIEPVEDAIWRLQPGDVTDVIQVGDAFYIAQLENRKAGRVRAFEEEAVQQTIRRALEADMLLSLRKLETEALLRDAVIFPDPPDTRVVLDMAMQKYPTWATAAQ